MKSSRHFSEKELKCKHTGECEMDEDFMTLLETLRMAHNKPMHLSSAYRSPDHPIELKKDKPGDHANGKAIDVLCYGEDALNILNTALALGFNAIGISQKGEHKSRFIHIGMRKYSAIWSY